MLCALYTLIPLLFRVVDDGEGSLLCLSGAYIKLIQCARHAAVPIIYMAFPPTMPVWDDLVEMDEKGVQRPKRYAQDSNKDDGGGFAEAWSSLAEIIIIFIGDWH